MKATPVTPIAMPIARGQYDEADQAGQDGAPGGGSGRR
jgi:hypothetical protein